MKFSIALGTIALVATAVTTAAMPMQDKQAAQMEAWKQAGEPGPQHQEFADCVGTWSTKCKYWMDPSQPPQEGEGVSTFETVMGGRYLLERASGNGPMGSFEGLGLMAYNNITGEYEHVWLDDKSTGLMLSKGMASADGSTVLRGEMVDPTTKDKFATRVVCKKISDDVRTIEMHCNQTGSEKKSMEITYTRGAGG
jgi:hypothetical protein